MKYAQVTSDGYVVYFIEATVEQPDLVLIDYEISECPNNGYKFNVNTRTWVDSTEQEKYADAVQNIETIRIDLLYKSDWTQIPNNPLTAQQQSDWATYRQALRDIPQQSGYPLNVIFPTPPA